MYAYICHLFQADVDNNGTLDYGEFIAATLNLNKIEREENLLVAFSYFDKDGNGFIDMMELTQALSEESVSDSGLVQAILNEVDTDMVRLS